jgi:hypothetical protein
MHATQPNAYVATLRPEPMPPMHRSYLRILSAALLLTFLTGCLTIEENYTFKRNGSGSMEYVVDMSEVGELLKTIGEMGEGGGGASDMGSLDMNDEMNALRKLPGISRVKLDGKKKWVQRLSFRFANVEALNSALNILMTDSTGQPHTFFRWEEGTLVRTNNRHAYELGAGMARDGAQTGEEGEEGADMSAFLEAMKYRYSFKFANAVGETESAPGVVREKPGAREVKFETNWAVISQDRQALDLRIPLAR